MVHCGWSGKRTRTDRASRVSHHAPRTTFLKALRVPDRLGLGESRDQVGGLAVEVSVRPDQPLDVVNRSLFDPQPEAVDGPCQIDGVDVHVIGQPGANSDCFPVNMFTTPGGTSELSKTSAS